MAQKNWNVLLGFEDVAVKEKHKNDVNFTTNKFGGTPDLPMNVQFDNPKCAICQFPKPLVLQIYAPLEGSAYHRTLYIFACINTNCWNRNESWSCVRVQCMDSTSSTEKSPKKTSVTDWCADADDWGDADPWDDEDNANVTEENGNLIGRASDEEEDESSSFDDGIRLGVGNLAVDDRNANVGGSPEAHGAVGRIRSPAATAEIEGNEGEAISIDTPPMPDYNIIALLEEATPLPADSTDVQFHPYFVSVYEESNATAGDHHVKELIHEYQQRHGDDLKFNDDASARAGGGKENQTSEEYERTGPRHGDKVFHSFYSRIKTNPGQLLRYSRESAHPLLISPLQDAPRRCAHCQEEMVFELQILPTLISRLHLISDPRQITRLGFGNVLVFTCKKSCWGDSGCRHEVVVVQKEIL